MENILKKEEVDFFWEKRTLIISKDSHTHMWIEYTNFTFSVKEKVNPKTEWWFITEDFMGISFDVNEEKEFTSFYFYDNVRFWEIDEDWEQIINDSLFDYINKLLHQYKYILV